MRKLVIVPDTCFYRVIVLLSLFTEERVGIQGNRPQDGGDRSREGGLPENPSRGNEKED